MRTKELLELYKQGNREFSRQNLTGKSFRGQDLSGCNFSGADIRGADFTYAILRGADFTGVKSGLLPFQKWMIFIASLISSLMLGVVAGWMDALVELEFHSSDGFGGIAPQISAKWIVLVILLVFGYVAQRYGLTAGFNTFIFALVVTGAGAFLSSSFVAIAAGVVIAITVVAFIAVVTTIIVILSLTTALSVSLTAAALVIAAFAPVFTLVAAPSAGESSVVLAIAVTVISAYIGWKAFQGDERHAVLWGIAENLATRQGTSFREADLTNADFSQAKLKSTSFSGAILNRTRMASNLQAGYAG
jgi:uncharacterized protein YjbI with pentapeptide repeats